MISNVLSWLLGMHNSENRHNQIIQHLAEIRKVLSEHQKLLNRISTNMASREELRTKIESIKATITAEAEQSVQAVLIAVQSAVSPLQATIEELKAKIAALEAGEDFSQELLELENINTGIAAIIADTPVEVPPEPPTV